LTKPMSDMDRVIECIVRHVEQIHGSGLHRHSPNPS
jgi:hypothetical protein